MSDAIATRKQLNMEFAYEDVKDLVHSLAWTHQRKHGGYIEDLLSDAYYAFVLAVDSWEPLEGSLTTHVWHRVKGYLLECRRRNAMRYHRVGRYGRKTSQLELTEEIKESAGRELDHSFMADLLDELKFLNEDAELLVKILIEDSFHLEVEVAVAAQKARFRPTQRGLKRYMADTFGWSERRTHRAWEDAHDLICRA